MEAGWRSAMSFCFVLTSTRFRSRIRTRRSDFRFVVSGRLKAFFQNGKHYCDLRVSGCVCMEA
ncbi:hypothetical protein RGR602_CH00167 [Rhizobium gallicum bv. gallicum R602sp]|uniref:Uncharacterized protein n=1 Tax=Rhizobium gallicum bv. gallicum R602sp TaxID=1041138 RepID=A0A0B4WX37_9HYPH|nr:hypothetical protein RGR602_CH00167 [Rhizobium gallicum bv. gallicum R602sp]